MKIGPHRIEPALILAPMAGITDKPFRILCKRLGAGLCVSEMTAANPDTWHTRQSRLRRDHAGEPEPVSVQIAGYDPRMMAEAARFNVDHGAAMIDIDLYRLHAQAGDTSGARVNTGFLTVLAPSPAPPRNR